MQLILSCLFSMLVICNLSSARAATIEISSKIGFSCLIEGNKGSLVGITSSNKGKTLNPKTEANKLKNKIAVSNKKLNALKKSLTALKKQNKTPKNLKQIASTQAKIAAEINQGKAFKVIVASIKDCVNGVLRAPEVCGNGFLEADEQCDDGNKLDGDCCSATCTSEPAGSSCTSANAVDCGQCNLSGQCVAGGSGAICNDRDACTSSDICQAGNCVGTSVVCPGRNHASSSCTLGVCVLSCDAGFVDANANPVDGCETIVCPGSQTSCNNVCKILSNDKDNCGSCGNACSGNQTCQNGVCEVLCPVGQTFCNGVCVDTSNNSLNCGICGNSCNDSNRCTADSCQAGSCSYVPNSQVLSCGIGACFRSTLSCSNGANQTCVPGSPTAEVCNGIDDNCDGIADNSATCPALANATNSCINGGCAMTKCNGDNYDVDNNAANGCEVSDNGGIGHAIQNSTFLGNVSCNDNTTSEIDGFIPSDTATHDISGFSTATGSAPDFYHINATGGNCINDFVASIRVGGEGGGNCYALTVTTTDILKSAITSNGIATIVAPSPAYTSGSLIQFKVSRVCTSAVRANESYSIFYHL